MKEFEMFVVTHKPIFWKLKKEYIPIQVGNKDINPNYIKDNTGINISEKNDNYCELTAIYWLWKNYDLPNYIGISHYRRFFFKRPFYNLVDTKHILNKFKKYDVIQPYPYNTKSNVKENFITSGSGREKDVNRLEKIIKQEYSEYYEEFNTIMNSKGTSYLNMMIMKKDDFKKYCEWLFEILFKYEKTTDLTGYSKQEARIYGFMSEFLLNVWIRKNKLKVGYCNTILVEENKTRVFLKKIRCIIYDFKRLIVGEL